MAQRGRLTTHVLDTASGRPAEGLKIALYRKNGAARELLKEVVTNDDGRCDAPLLEGEAFQPGQYELIFHAGDYLRRSGQHCLSRCFSTKFPSASVWLKMRIIMCRSCFRHSVIRPIGAADG